MLHPVGLYTARGTTDPTVNGDAFQAPSNYIRASDAPAGTVSTWPAHKGSDAVGDTAGTRIATEWLGTRTTVDLADTTDAYSFTDLTAPHTTDPTRSIMVVVAALVRADNAYVFGLSNSGSSTQLKGFVVRTGGAIGFVLRDNAGTLHANSSGAGGSILTDGSPQIIGLMYDGSIGGGNGRALAKTLDDTNGLVTRHDQNFALAGATTFDQARVGKVRSDTRLDMSIGLVSIYDGEAHEAKLNAEMANAAAVYPLA